MRKSLLFILISLFTINAYAQRIAVDSASVYTSGAPNSSGNPLSLLQADFDYFWVTYIKEKAPITTGHSGWLGNIQIEHRDTLDLSVTDSIVLKGKSAVLETESDDAGNLYVLGYVKDSLMIGTTKIGNEKHYLMKLTPKMQVVWINDTIEGDRFSVSANGNYLYLIEDHNGFGNSVDLLKLNTSGSVINRKTLPGIGYISDIKANDNGDIFISGSCMAQSVILDTVDASHSFTYSLYFGKLDKDMVCEWMKVLEDVTCPPTWLDLESNGNLLFQSPMYKSNKLGSFQLDASITEEFVLASTAPDGNVHYAVDVPGTGHRVGVSRFHNKNMASHNNITATVLMHKGNNDTLDWGNNVQTISNVWNGRPILLEYSVATGKAQMATYLSFDNYTEYTNLLVLDNDDILTARTTKDSEMVITKMRYMKKPTGIHTLTDNEIQMYPNPSDGIVNTSRLVSGNIYSISGMQVKSINNTDVINITDQPAGIYYLRTEDGSVIRFIKQ